MRVYLSNPDFATSGISFGPMPYRFDANGYTYSTSVDDIVRLVTQHGCTLVQITEGDDEEVETQFYLLDLKQELAKGDYAIDAAFKQLFDPNYSKRYNYLLTTDSKSLFYKEAGR